MKALIAFVLCLTCLVSTAHGDDVGREAGKHFARGVELYNDGDFRGALVEFRRAYALLPRANVLYDIGETEFQLQDYAAALITMRRYLGETGPSASHRAEVEATVETLRGRVGRIALAADVAHCDVSIDEQAVGTTPLADSVLVSIGPRKVSVSCSDRPVATRRVDVTAGELARVEIMMGPVLAPGPRQAPKVSAESLRRRRTEILAITWTTTALLAAATIGVGAATLVESSQLSELRQTYPVQAGAIDSKAALTKGLSIAADALGVAALTAIGVSTYVTIKNRNKDRKLVLGFGMGLASASVRGTF